MPHYLNKAELLTGPKAFQRDSPSVLLCQSAILLMLGLQHHANRKVWDARRGAISSGVEEFVPQADRKAFPVPTLRPTSQRFNMLQVKEQLIRRYGPNVPKAKGRVERFSVLAKPLGDIVNRLYREPMPATAAELMEACLLHPHELVRVAAAAAHMELSLQLKRLVSIMRRGTASTDPLVRGVSATTLARVVPENPALRKLTRATRRKVRSKRALTSLIVHGTWARNESWWQVGGDFHTYILTNVTPDLYSAADAFAWSGGYSDTARQIAAEDLSNWIGTHHLGSVNEAE